MYDVEKIRNDFPILKNGEKQGQPIVFLDNCATTLKPNCVIDAVVNYYKNYCANAHRGDYDLSYAVDKEFEETRNDIASFLNTDNPREIVYTNGATSALNIVANGYGQKFLNKGDVVLTTEAEHASCILPWMKVAKDKGAFIKYIPLDEEGKIKLSEFEKQMSEEVKVVVVAQITNVLGYIAPIKEICKISHQNNAIVLVDGAQSVPHIPVDVKDLDCDFLTFSAHKMCGPTGIGVLYGKMDLLKKMNPYNYGGASNANYDIKGNIQLKHPPYKFESGTMPLEGVFGLHAAIKYLQSIGMKNIHDHEVELHNYAMRELLKMEHIHVYTPNNGTGIITFNVKNVFGQDIAKFFNHYGIAVRSGQHCSKLMTERLGSVSTVRASLYLYTSKDDINYFLEICRKATKDNCMNLLFR